MKILESELRLIVRRMLLAESFVQDWTVERAGELPFNSKLLTSESHLLPRRELNVPLLIEKKALYITHAHDEPLKDNPDYQNEDGFKQINAQDDKGWIILPEETWLFSVITHWNTLQGDWAKDAPKYRKPQSYREAADYIREEITDGKYLQILWSASERDLNSDQVFLRKK